MQSPQKNQALPSILGLISDCTGNQEITIKKFMTDFHIPSDNNEESNPPPNDPNQAELQKKLSKSKWNQNEDELLKIAVKKYGSKNWKLVSTLVPNRNGKQCRERWISHINPTLTNSKWTYMEDFKLMQLHNTYGNKWSHISHFLPGRSGNSIKNRYLFLIRRKVPMNSIVQSGLNDSSSNTGNTSDQNITDHNVQNSTSQPQ